MCYYEFVNLQILLIQIIIDDYKFCIILLFSVHLCFIIIWCGCDMHFSDLKDLSPQSHDAVYCIYENKLSSY